MSMTDPIADMLTRIRNAILAKHEDVSVPASKIKQGIASILREEGFIKDFQMIEDDKQGLLKIQLKYAPGEKSVIHGLQRVSKPGIRVYVKREEIPQVLDGLGVAILSTSRGVLTDKTGRQLGIGGEVLCYVW
ncbi:MAG: 30S ribosomal protein S8 [Candidatus Tectomicrobia bacterium]|uniref:Small ribosomal subunit protein uS8 n=1 Tax=Tectimicrobiota bacterium TaxID=2528274 RepID=A0A932CQK9_UNCTE|nr:30S ribosomal protein S8 [Candidatus Tectomicrobia bacterium]